jgi:hypothetical protein
MGKKATLLIDKEGEFVVNTADINSNDRATCISMSQILNIIVKESMSSTGMIQIGRHPRFFNHENPIIVPEMNISIWKGFKFSAYKYQDSCALILDDCCRFMSTKTVLERINEIYDELEESRVPNHNQAFQDHCCQEIIGSSVIANYGKKRTYIVYDIRFGQGPCDS